MDTGQAHIQDYENGHQLNWPGAFEGKPHKVTYFPPLPNQEQAYILKDFLSTFLPLTRDQAYLVQLSQPSLLKEVETHGLLSVLRQVGFTDYLQPLQNDSETITVFISYSVSMINYIDFLFSFLNFLSS